MMSKLSKISKNFRSKFIGIKNWLVSTARKIRNFDPQLMEWLNNVENPVRTWQNLGLGYFFLLLGYIAGDLGNQFTLIWMALFISLINYIGFKLSHKADQARMMIQYMGDN